MSNTVKCSTHISYKIILCYEYYSRGFSIHIQSIPLIFP